MTWKFWTWFQKPEVNVKPESRIGFQLMGAKSSGWQISEDYLRISASGCGMVEGIHITIDNFIIWTIRSKDQPIPVNSGDVVCYSLINILRESMSIKP